MISQVKITFWWLMSVILVFNLFIEDKSQFIEVRHEIVIEHPGEKLPVPTTLIEVRNEDQVTVEYHMAVESVICLAEVCKVIPVTLHWNSIGDYQRYELQKGATLEKYEADFFEPNDYKKLDKILKDNYSPFSDVFIEDIWTVPSTVHDDVDAISGATILELDEEDTVPGAALTCYTLWHWANGNIVSIIKGKTGESASKEQLKSFISNKNEAYFNIAIKALNQQNLYSEDFVQLIVDRVKKDDHLLREAFEYLENTSTQLYQKGVSDLFFNGDKPQKLAVIRSLKKVKNTISTEFIDNLSSEFENLKSFHEVSALIDLMETKDNSSAMVNKNLMSLLDSEFLIARRVYWFLTNQQLTSKQQLRLQKFQKEHKERL